MLESSEREILLENNKILHKLLSAQRWATFWSVLRWAVLLGIPIVGYYYAQPYLEKLLNTYEQVSGQVSQVSGQVSGQVSNLPKIGDLLPFIKR